MRVQDRLELHTWPAKRKRVVYKQDAVALADRKASADSALHKLKGESSTLASACRVVSPSAAWIKLVSWSSMIPYFFILLADHICH